MNDRPPPLVPLLALTALVAGGCAEVPQIPGQGQAFEVRPLGERYAVSVDPTGRPLGIWDLSYPVVERETWQDCWGAHEEATFPVRLVNFEDPGEPARILTDEGWRFGVNSWFGAAVSVGYLKWRMATELLDVREIRKLQAAALAEYLAGRSAADPELEASGLGSAEVRAALDQLAVVGAAAAPARGPLDAVVRADLARILEDLAARTRAILDDEPVFHGPVDEPAWGRVGDELLESRDGYPLAGTGKDRVVAMHEAVLRLQAAAGRWQVATEVFGTGDRLALAHVLADGADLPVGVYDLTGDEPVLFVPLVDLLEPPGPVDENASLTVAEIGAVTVIASNFLASELVGFTFPLPGLVLNTITSIWPFAPFRSEDPQAAACGRLLALVGDDRAPVPAFVDLHRAEVARRIDRRMRAGNRFWPRPAQRAELLEVHRRKLERASSESLHGAAFGVGSTR